MSTKKFTLAFLPGGLKWTFFVDNLYILEITIEKKSCIIKNTIIIVLLINKYMEIQNNPSTHLPVED